MNLKLDPLDKSHLEYLSRQGDLNEVINPEFQMEPGTQI